MSTLRFGKPRKSLMSQSDLPRKVFYVPESRLEAFREAAQVELESVDTLQHMVRVVVALPPEEPDPKKGVYRRGRE